MPPITGSVRQGFAIEVIQSLSRVLRARLGHASPSGTACPKVVGSRGAHDSAHRERGTLACTIASALRRNHTTRRRSLRRICRGGLCWPGPRHARRRRIRRPKLGAVEAHRWRHEWAVPLSTRWDLRSDEGVGLLHLRMKHAASARRPGLAVLLCGPDAEFVQVNRRDGIGTLDVRTGPGMFGVLWAVDDPATLIASARDGRTHNWTFASEG